MSDLLTIEDIAEMHHCDSRRARDVIVKLPGFPGESNSSTPRKRLWLRSDVRAYIRKKPAQNAHSQPSAA